MPRHMEQIEKVLEGCDLLVVVGTSSTVRTFRDELVLAE
jgi:NAD-dependent SIR2 family protein deacetylase